MAQRFLYFSLCGTIVTAICCFTPLLVWAMALLGLSAYLAWLDVVLLPLLGVFAALTIIAFIKKRSVVHE